MTLSLRLRAISRGAVSCTTCSVQSIALFILLSVALVVWLRALPFIDPERMTDRGLISVLSPPFHLSLTLVAAGFAWQMSYGRPTGVLPYLYLLALVLVLHATPALVYGTLRYSWAWKHLGIVDYIQRHGAVDRSIPFLAAYHNWPGLFVATAWLSDRFGMRAVDLAPIVQFTPVALTLALLVAVMTLLRTFTSDPRLLLTAGWLFIVANWVGQDYFSPQGVTFLGYVILLGLFLGPLRKSAIPWATHRPGFLAFLGPAAGLGRPACAVGAPLRLVSAIVAPMLIIAIVVTHQLTPIVIILAALALAALGWISLSYFVFAVIAEAIWLLWGAAPFVLEHVRGELSTLGSLTEATTKLANVTAVSADRAVVVLVGRVLSAAILLAGLYGGLRRLFSGFWDVTAVALALAPTPLLLIAYGGEAVFRVYLFALPFFAFFGGAAFFPSQQHGRSGLIFPVLTLACLLSALGFLFANNGKDREYRFALDEIAVAQWVYSTAPKDSLLIEGARSYPSQFMNYENFSYLPISEESAATRKMIAADPAGVLFRWMDDPRWKDAYIILTTSQKAYLEAGGYMQIGDFDKIKNALLASPRFRVVRASSHAIVFRILSDTPPRDGYGGGGH